MGLKATALVAGWLALGGWDLPAGTTGEVPGADVFSNQPPRRLTLEISSRHLDQLRRDPRKYVPATLREGTQSWTNVAVHLKGSGSFRPLDDKPSFTLSFERWSASQRYHGLRKIHLNNSVEDPTWLNERVGQEVFQAAHVPAARVGWALVEFNGRKLGLYVLKEGFTPEFLGLWFTNTTGNLYEGSGHDVTDFLNRESGSGPDDQADLKALAAAVQEPDVNQRWPRLESALNMDPFLSFMAMEVLAGHRDGYCLARNNYRIYCDPGARQPVFLPHGMDVLFGRPEALIEPAMAGLVAQAVMTSPAGRLRYRQRLGVLATNVLDPATLSRDIDQWSALLRPAVGLGQRGEYDHEVALLKARITQRQEWVAKMCREPEPAPLRFDGDGVCRLTNWVARDVPANGRLEASRAPDGQPALHIVAGPNTAAAWESRVLLPAGHYRFEGGAWVMGVKPRSGGRNDGASLRVGGMASTQAQALRGESGGWKKIGLEFDRPAGPSETELLCELRAAAGEAWFDLGSLRLVRIP
jgi:spore coat protein H